MRRIKCIGRTHRIGWIEMVLSVLVVGMFSLLPPGGAALAGGMPGTGSQNVKQAQETLSGKGFYKGKIDGIMGPKTRAAIREYQRAEKLPVTGRLDAKTESKMGVGQGSVGASFSNAGHEAASGSKAAAREITKGKPVAAGVKFGKGMGRFGKSVGKGVKKAVKP